MQLDFERGKRGELNTLTGYVARFARNSGIGTPTP